MNHLSKKIKTAINKPFTQFLKDELNTSAQLFSLRRQSKKYPLYDIIYFIKRSNLTFEELFMNDPDNQEIIDQVESDIKEVLEGPKEQEPRKALP